MNFPQRENLPRVSVSQTVWFQLLFAWCVATVVLLAGAWPSLDTVVDDAYISARYAAVAAEGGYLSYNLQGTRVEGISNPSWTFGLLLARMAGWDMHRTMVWGGVIWGILALSALLWLSFELSGRRRPGLSAVPMLLLAMDPHFHVVVSNGLESSMYMALVIGACAALHRSPFRWRLTLGLLGASIAVTRPEGLGLGFAIVVLGCLVTAENRRFRFSGLPLFGFLVGVVPFLVWRLVQFGALVPNTVIAKMEVSPGALLRGHASYLSADLSYWMLAVVLPVFALLLTGWHRKWLPILVVMTLTVAVAVPVRLWMPGGRLLLLPMAFSCLFAVPILETIPSRRRQWLIAGCMLVATGIGFSVISGKVRSYDVRHSVQPGNGASLAARHLAAHAPEGAVLAIRDAGLFAFEIGTKVHVVEIHPRALTQPHPDGANLDPTALFHDDPAFIVLTSNREERPDIYYREDRHLVKHLSEPYRYLGRVLQHYHRYYDILVRGDLSVPPLPTGVVMNRALRSPFPEKKLACQTPQMKCARR